MTYFYISFATKAGFRGATVVEAADSKSALTVATLRGLNPGGEAAILEVPPESESAPDLHAMKNRLVGEEEMLAMGGRKGRDLPQEINEAWDHEISVVCELCNAGLPHRH
jgi:hypothetical protein